MPVKSVHIRKEVWNMILEELRADENFHWHKLVNDLLEQYFKKHRRK